MKNLTIVGFLMLGIGFALGWLVKPVPTAKQLAGEAGHAVGGPASVAAANVASSSSSGSEAPPAGKRAIREVGSKKNGGVDQAEIEKQSKKMQAEMMKQMLDRTRSKFTLRIDHLAEKLNLSPEQKALMTADMEKKLAEFERLDFSDPTSYSKMTTETDWMPTEKGLLASVQGSLSAEQKDSLAALQTTERHTKADTLALKNLSKLQGIVPLEEGQRDEVYKILTENAEASVNAEEDKPDPTSFFTDGMGMDMDPYDLGLTRLMTEMGPDMESVKPGDTKGIMQRMRDAMQKRIDAKVEQLRPVLNDKQLEIYKNELNAKGMGFYGAAFGGVETTETIETK